MTNMRTDKELLDWLGKQDGCGLISDDAGRWAFSGSGMQNIPNPDEPIDIMTSYFVEAKDWKPSIREALVAGMEQETDL